jgi:hypothetical protein
MTALFFDKTIANCSAGCNEELIGDFFCNMECNNSLCDFDGGDCLDINIENNTNFTNDNTNFTNDNTNFTNDNLEEYYHILDSNIGSNTGSCNLTSCPNLFFDDCNILQKYTDKWCNFDDDDHNYDICCAKYHTDCCEYDVLAVFLASFSFFLLVICSFYGVFKMVYVCCDE